MNDLIVRHTDGLAIHDLANMDMDQFREWLWPGIEVKLYLVDTLYRTDGSWLYCVAKEIAYRPSQTSIWYGTWSRVCVHASSVAHAKRKAMAMVHNYLTKSHGPCTMTTGGSHGQG